MFVEVAQVYLRETKILLSLRTASRAIILPPQFLPQEFPRLLPCNRLNE